MIAALCGTAKLVKRPSKPAKCKLVRQHRTVIVSDDTGQFSVGQHGLCWVHAERLVHKLDTFTDEQREAQRKIRDLAVLSRSQSLSPRSHRPAQGILRARFEGRVVILPFCRWRETRTAVVQYLNA